MILHLADDSIFLDYAIDQFEEVAPGFSIYLVNSDTPHKIKNIEKIIAAESNSKQYKDIIKNLSQYDAVILHALTNDKIQIVNNSSKEVNFVWFFWGADGFYLNRFKTRVYSKKTIQTLRIISNYGIYQKLKSFVLSFDFFLIPFTLFKHHKMPEDFQRIKAIKRMNFCVPVIEEDFYFIKNKLKLKAKLINCNYGSIENLTHSFTGDKKNQKTSFLVGNSGDPANNHIDILDLLKEINVKDIIISPLSYGNDEYIKFIIKYGVELFGTKFKPITKFLPLEEYNDLICSAKVVIMNHFIQQAMGNIYFTLWNGAKLFISRKSTVFNFFNRNGVIFSTIEEDLTKQNAFAPLKKEEIDLNRKFVNNYFSKNVVLKKTELLINKISDN